VLSPQSTPDPLLTPNPTKALIPADTFEPSITRTDDPESTKKLIPICSELNSQAIQDYLPICFLFFLFFIIPVLIIKNKQRGNKHNTD
jgi:hypothetical protein